jgi:hypothetical protein
MEPNDPQVHFHFGNCIHVGAQMFKVFVGKCKKHQIGPLGHH